MNRLCLVLLLCACPDKAPAVAAVPGPKAPPAECEFSGEVRPGEVKAARILFAITKQPCTTAPDPGVIIRVDVQPGKLFHEFFFPQGSTGYACAFALDEQGQLVGQAGHARGQLTFQGFGEVEFKDVLLELTPVPARVAPPGL